MSTHIKDIWDLTLQRFWNWSEAAIQITPLNERGYSQLTKKEIEELIRTLQFCFDLDVYPSE